MGKTRLDMAENMAGQACGHFIYILEKNLCRQDHSQYLSQDWVLAWVPKKSLSLVNWPALQWQPTKYPQGHRYHPYFTVHITTMCWNPPK